MVSLNPPLGLLFKLPLELREMVYGYLTPEARLPTIIRAQELGVSSVSHRPPPVDLLLVCHQIYAEALDVYYRKCIFRLDGLLDPANIFPLWQVEAVLGGTNSGRVILANMRKVELNLFWHALSSGRVANTDDDGSSQLLAMSETNKRIERLHRATQVLQRGTQFKTAIVTWKEIPASPGEVPWDQTMKESVLGPLTVLENVGFMAGDIVASSDWSQRLVGILGELNRGIAKQKNHDQPRSRAYLDLVEVAGHAVTEFGGQGFKQTSYFG